MDLREAGDRWAAKAADIERQAAELHAQAGSEDAKTQLLAEMRAANYRNTAEAWRNLARDSWLRFQFQSGDQADENAHANPAPGTPPSTPPPSSSPCRPSPLT